MNEEAIRIQISDIRNLQVSPISGYIALDRERVVNKWYDTMRPADILITAIMADDTVYCGVSSIVAFNESQDEIAIYDYGKIVTEHLAKDTVRHYCDGIDTVSETEAKRRVLGRFDGYSIPMTDEARKYLSTKNS